MEENPMLPVGISAGYANFYFESETIELFIEDQALSPSYDLAPPPPRRPPSVNSSRPATHKKTERDILLTKEGVGVEPNHTKARKPGPV
jgi:hypothetical protein